MAKIKLRLLITNDRVAIGERAVQSGLYSAREVVELRQSKSRLVELIRQDGISYDDIDVAPKRIAEFVHSK